MTNNTLQTAKGFDASRRSFVLGSTALGAGFSLGLSLPSVAVAQAAIPLKTSDEVDFFKTSWCN